MRPAANHYHREHHDADLTPPPPPPLKPPLWLVPRQKTSQHLGWKFWQYKFLGGTGSKQCSTNYQASFTLSTETNIPKVNPTQCKAHLLPFCILLQFTLILIKADRCNSSSSSIFLCLNASSYHCWLMAWARDTSSQLSGAESVQRRTHANSALNHIKLQLLLTSLALFMAAASAMSLFRAQFSNTNLLPLVVIWDKSQALGWDGMGVVAWKKSGGKRGRSSDKITDLGISAAFSGCVSAAVAATGYHRNCSVLRTGLSSPPPSPSFCFGIHLVRWTTNATVSNAVTAATASTAWWHLFLLIQSLLHARHTAQVWQHVCSPPLLLLFL